MTIGIILSNVFLPILVNKINLRLGYLTMLLIKGTFYMCYTICTNKYFLFLIGFLICFSEYSI